MTGGEGRLTLRNVKQKDAPEQPPVDVVLQVQAGSVVVVEAGGVGALGGADLPTAAFETLEALRAIDVPEGVSSATWQKASDATERTFFRHRAGLVKFGHVTNVGSDKQPKYRPADLEEPS